MAIIFDTDGFSGQTYQGYLEKALLKSQANELPGNQFICTKPADIQDVASNISIGDFPAQKGLFHQKKTEKWLQQHRAEVFISFKRMLKTACPLKQVLIIAGEEQLLDEKTVRSATAVGVVSAGLSHLFTEKYPDLHSKAILLEGIADETAPAYTMTDDIRETIASGREYFMLADFNLTRDKLTTLLKGFSAFKKRLYSSWKFMIVLRSEETIKKTDVETLLSNYKYREDVILTGRDLLHEKMRDAYALVSMDDSERLPLPVIEAALVDTPAIAPATATLQQTYGEAVAYFDADTSDAVGNMLMKIYKDESFRQSLVKKLSNNISSPEPGRAAAILRQLLVK